MKWTILPRGRARADTREWCWIIIGRFTMLSGPRVLDGYDVWFTRETSLHSYLFDVRSGTLISCSRKITGALSEKLKASPRPRPLPITVSPAFTELPFGGEFERRRDFISAVRQDHDGGACSFLSALWQCRWVFPPPAWCILAPRRVSLLDQGRSALDNMSGFSPDVYINPSSSGGPLFFLHLSCNPRPLTHPPLCPSV